MADSLKKAVSLISYDQEKSEREEQNLPKKKPIPGFLIWQTRRNSVQAYMCITLNVANMLQFAGALIMYGGAVWVAYLTWAVVVGVPMITAELALGHYINNEIKYVWGMCRIGKGIFWNCLLSTFVTAFLFHIYLTVLLQLAFQPNEIRVQDHVGGYMTKCGNKSASIFPYKSYRNYCQPEGSYFPLTNYLSYDHKSLHISQHHFWVPVLYLSGICFLMILINSKGIRSLEKVTSLFVLVPYLCAVILAMLTFTLPGAVRYIVKSWHLDWYKLREFSVWYVSFKTMVKEFSIGSLNLIFVSVHSDFHDDIMIDVVILFLNIFLNNLLFTITLSGLIGIVNNMVLEPETDTNFHDFVSILLGAINGLKELPPPKWLWNFFFYSYFIGCAIAQLTLTVASVADVIISLAPKFKTNRFYVTTALCLVFFLIGICIFATETLKTPNLDSSFLTTGLLQSITIFWIYNYERVCADFHFLMGYKPSLFYQLTWVISPIIFLGVILTKLCLQQESDLFAYNDIYLTSLHLGIYIICAIIQVLLLKRKGESINIFHAEKSWGPTDPLLKESRIIFKSRIITKEHIYRQKLYEEQLVKPADITDQNVVQLL